MGLNLRIVVACAGIAVALSGCGAGGGQASPEGAAGSSASQPPATSSSPASEQPVAPSAGSATRAPDAVAPSGVRSAVRKGAPATPSYVVPEKKIAERSTFSDGVAVTVGGLTQGVTQGRGVGALPGSPMVTTQVSVRNGTAAALDLSTAVVSARYVPAGGSTELAAQLTYHEASKDLGGKLAAGAESVATYSFMMPPGAKVRVVVDLDANHAPAVFATP